MERFARGQWSDRQILDALRGRDGSQTIRFRADILRNNATDRAVTIAPGSSVSLDKDAAIGRTARLSFYEPLNWLKEEIKPYMLLRMGDQYAEFPLGVFIPSTPRRNGTDGANEWTVEAYDRTVILAEDGLDEPLYIAAGTLYLDAVQNILVSAGATNVMIADHVDTALPADREFEVGFSKLEVANILLSEINFNPIHCDVDGRFVLSTFKEPSSDKVDFAYAADALSIISTDTSAETDYIGMPNIFIAICSNPDLNEDYRSVYVNDNPASPFSTAQRGRRIVSEVYRPDQIASQADLDAYVRRIAYEQILSASETATFSTALMPVHGRGDTLAIRHPDVDGVFAETKWTIPLEAGAQMEHIARKVVLL